MIETQAYPAPIGRPLLQILVSFPIACFCGALATDITYAQTANIIWADFSAWLLAAGMAFGVLAAIVGAVGLVANRGTTRPRAVWPVAVGSLVVLGLALLDNLVHSRDAWTSVVPEGLALSAVTVAVMLGTAWLGATQRAPRRAAYGYSGARQ